MWFVYIIECGGTCYYTGISNDVEKRLKAHIAGKGAKFTRGKGNLVLKATWEFESKSEALKREIQIKKLSKIKKKELIDSVSELLFCETYKKNILT
jgi:putative endonuclease